MWLEILQKLVEFYVWLTGDRQIYDRVYKWYIIFSFTINDPWWQSVFIWCLFWFWIYIGAKRKWATNCDLVLAIVLFLLFFFGRLS